MTDNTNTTKAQKTDIEGLLGADKVKPFHKRGGFWLVLLVFLGILFAVYYFFFRGSQGQVGFVTQPLTKGNLTVEVSANGTINPIRTVSLGSELSGIVRKVNVDVNDQVKKGEVLIELDDTKRPRPNSRVCRKSDVFPAARVRVRLKLMLRRLWLLKLRLLFKVLKQKSWIVSRR